MAIERLVTADMPNIWGEVSRASDIYVTRSNEWARTGSYSIKFSGNSSTVKNFIVARNSTNPTEIYVRFALYFGTMPSPSDYYRILVAEPGIGHVGLNIDASGSFAIRRGFGLSGSSTGTLLGTLSKTLGVGQSACFECYVKIHDTEGVFSVKVDGVLDTELTNVDTRNGGSGYASILGFGGYGQGTFYVDDIAIATDWPGTFGNYVLWPNGPGDNAEWIASAGNPWECVDADADGVGDFTDYITDDTNIGKHDFAVENLPFTPAALGAVLLIGAGNVPSGSGTARVYAVSGATIANGDDMALSSDPVNMKKLLLVDPDTSEPWTAAGINGLKIGVESRT